jgi:hypothetical protein
VQKKKKNFTERGNIKVSNRKYQFLVCFRMYGIIRGVGVSVHLLPLPIRYQPTDFLENAVF